MYSRINKISSFLKEIYRKVWKKIFLGYNLKYIYSHCSSMNIKKKKNT